MFGAAAACRDKHRRSAVRAEAPPRGDSQNSPRWLRHENNSHTAIKTDKTSCQTTANKQRFLSLSRHYAASGLLNLQTTLTRAVALSLRV